MGAKSTGWVVPFINIIAHDASRDELYFTRETTSCLGVLLMNPKPDGIDAAIGRGRALGLIIKVHELLRLF